MSGLGFSSPFGGQLADPPRRRASSMKRCRQIPVRTQIPSEVTRGPSDVPGKPHSRRGTRGFTAALELGCLILLYGSLGLSGCAKPSSEAEAGQAEKAVSRSEEKPAMVSVRVFDRHGKLVG